MYRFPAPVYHLRPFVPRPFVCSSAYTRTSRWPDERRAATSSDVDAVLCTWIIFMLHQYPTRLTDCVVSSKRYTDCSLLPITRSAKIASVSVDPVWESKERTTSKQMAPASVG